MTIVAQLDYEANTAAFAVEMIDARHISDDIRLVWKNMVHANRALWSPHFDLRTTETLARHAKDAHILIAHDHGDIIGLFPFQGKKHGLIRPLGAPMSDQHGLICFPKAEITLAEMLARAKVAGLVYSGMLTPLDGGLATQASQCHVADLSQGFEAYQAWQKSHWNEQIKKNNRRIRMGENLWGPMRLEIACPQTSRYFETLMAWKQAKYIETNRHNVLGVAWITNTLRDFYESRDPDFAGEVTCLFFGDHLVALEYGLRAGQAMHSWFPAFDRAYAQVSPGILLMDAMIKNCAQRGLTKVDLGMGHAQYKRHASNAPMTVHGGTLPIGTVRRAGIAGLLAAHDWMGQHLPEAGANFLSRLQRRNEVILASEPTLTGRLKGYLAASKALGSTQQT